MWQRTVLFGAAFFACAQASRVLSVPDSTYISYWLPAGLYVAVLLASDTRRWPALVTAAVVANFSFDLWHATHPLAAALFCLANAVQSVGGAWLVRRYVAERPTLRTLPEFLGFLGFAGALGGAAGAAVGAATLVALGFSDAFWASWRVWWGSTAMSILLVSPFILTWASVTRENLRRFANPWRPTEAALLLATLGGLIAYNFTHGGIMAPDKGWLVFPLLWAALRFGPTGAATASLLVSLVVSFATTQLNVGLTPEQVASRDYVFVMQSSLVIVVLVTLVPAIVIGERDWTLARLRELSWRLVETQEVERRDISRELHDRVGQNLSALQLNLGILRSELPPGTPPSAHARLEDANSLLDTTSKQVRDVLAELRPAALDDFGLLAALRHHAALTEPRLGITIAVEGEDLAPRLPLATETALFRIAQEALNNVAKHARASKVRVILAENEDGVTLTISDDGVGFAGAPPRRPASYGMINMRERALAVGAALKIDSAPGRGTRLVVQVAT